MKHKWWQISRGKPGGDWPINTSPHGPGGRDETVVPVVRRTVRSRHDPERGLGLVEVLAAMCLLTIAICTAALVAVKGLVAARHARARADARTAASLLVNGTPPAAAGGAVVPATAVSGWSDMLVVDRATGAFVPLSGSVPEGAVPIRRQWRVASEGGVRVYSVSAELLEPDARTPLGAAQGGGVFHFNRVVR